MNVIAERGGTYLVGDVDGDAVIVDEQGRVGPPILAQSVLSRGYWTPFEGDPEPILEIVAVTMTP